MDNVPSEDLLHSVHPFPGNYQIKAIGTADDDFVARVVEAVIGELATPGELEHSVRVTPGGRHVSLTMDMTVQSAEQVRAIYSRIREVKGLTLLF
jgi:putative lipoic acid-binding regulatory protein